MNVPRYKPKLIHQLNLRKLCHDNGIMTFKNKTVYAKEVTTAW